MMRSLLRRHGASLLLILAGLAVGFAAPRLMHWIRPTYVTGDYRAHFEGRTEAVVLYGTSDCSFCRKARAYFKDHQIPVADLDVQTDAANQRRLQSLGDAQAVPVVLIGRRMIVGYQPEAYDAALAQLRP